MARVIVRYWAAARAAAGVEEESVDASSLADLLTAVGAQRDGSFRAVLSRSSFLVDGLAAGARDRALLVLTDGAVVEVLPPFAGG